jgi:sigma-54 dependent transcriptional regulator of gfr operon
MHLWDSERKLRGDLCMTHKEKVFLKLKERSLAMDGAKEYGITATDIADSLGLQRNIASHLLNELNKEGLAIKINTRPVYFIERDTYEKRKKELKLTKKYFSENYDKNKEETDREVFKDLIGFDGSLRYVVSQCKSAVSYPPNGLPLLLFGCSGVGKSFLAQLVFHYAKSIGAIKDAAPFILFNCAEYANNPELLSATLFGHCKGAYTGANNDRMGLIEEADGGFLFLDEIHRLPPEGQEKLFLFLDQGIFRRIGESGKGRNASVRMLFATTEDPESRFLQTFLRRIPLVVNIPTFQERPLKEKLELIYNFYKKESIMIKKDIVVSNQAIDILLKSKVNGNIGKLSNAIKISCANAFNVCNDKRSHTLKININNLPKELINHYEGMVLNKINFNDMFLSCTDKNGFNYVTKELRKAASLNTNLLNLIKAFQKCEVNHEQFFNKGIVICNELVDNIIFNEIEKNTNTVIFNSIEKIVENTLMYVQENYGVKHYGNSVQIITHLLSYFVEYNSEHNENPVDDCIDYVRKLYSKECKIAMTLIDAVEQGLDLSIHKIVILYILLYIRSTNRDVSLDQIYAVIIAHGYSTASSIAGLANRILEQYIFEAFDMPFELSAAEIGKKLNSYIRTIDTSKGLVILVDMGSLENVYKEIGEEFYGDIVIINNISTQLALDVGNRILNSQPLEQVAKEVVDKNVCRYSYIPSKKKKKDVIITTCFTGIGIAKKIKDLLNRCFVNDEVKVIAYDYDKLKENGKENYVFRQYNIKLIIGTDDPQIEEIPYLSLEDLIMQRGDMVLANALRDLVDKEIIEQINKEVVKSFTLYNVVNYLTILNPDKILEQVEQALYTLEIGLGFKFQNNLKISLSIHICCMIERLVIKEPIAKYNETEELGPCNLQFQKLIRKAFALIEQFYKVEIPNSEIKVIYDSIKARVKEFTL